MPGRVFYDKMNLMSDKKQIIVMMGGPGVGKGTFSQMLMSRHPYQHIEAGAILRAEPAESEIGKLIAAGNLVPDNLVCDLMASCIGDADIILDGFPRTLPQAKWLVEHYASRYCIHVLYFAVSHDVLIARIKKRVRDGSLRADDASISVINRRLDNFERITMPAVEWLRNAPGIRFSEIDARGDVDDNFADIIAALGTRLHPLRNDRDS